MSYTAFQALVKRDLRLYLPGQARGHDEFCGADRDREFLRLPVRRRRATIARRRRSRWRLSIRMAARFPDAWWRGSGRTRRSTCRLADWKRRARRCAAARSTVAAVIPKGFGDDAARALFRGENKPEIQLLYDPSHGPELQMVRGMLTQHVMEAVSGEAFSGPGSRKYLDESRSELEQRERDERGRPESRCSGCWTASAIGPSGRAAGTGGAQAGVFRMPYAVKEEAVTARKGVAYNGMAHSFAGMCVQFILFMGIDAGMVVLQQRRTGLWKRLQASPLSRWTIIGSRAASAAIVAMIIMLVVFGFARVVFGVKIEGSIRGIPGCVRGVRADDGEFRTAGGGAGQDARGNARHRDSGDLDAGDAGRQLGAGLPVSAMAAAGELRGADALGGGWPGRAGVARMGIGRKRWRRWVRWWRSRRCSARSRCGDSGGSRSEDQERLRRAGDR